MGVSLRCTVAAVWEWLWKRCGQGIKLPHLSVKDLFLLIKKVFSRERNLLFLHLVLSLGDEKERWSWLCKICLKHDISKMLFWLIWSFQCVPLHTTDMKSSHNLVLLLPTPEATHIYSLWSPRSTKSLPLTVLLLSALYRGSGVKERRITKQDPLHRW